MLNSHLSGFTASRLERWHNLEFIMTNFINFIWFAVTYIAQNFTKFWYVWVLYILIQFAELYVRVQGVING